MSEVNEVAGRQLSPLQQVARVRAFLSHPSIQPALHRHRDIAGSTSIAAAEMAQAARDTLPGAVAAREFMEQSAIYALAVSDYASWLAGQPATPSLIRALDLHQENQ